jgi:hypothetical protein
VAILDSIRGGLGALLSGKGGADSVDPSSDLGVDESKALQFTQDRWNDLKNSYVVIHQSIWQSLLFYANQSWIDW